MDCYRNWTTLADVIFDHARSVICIRTLFELFFVNVSMSVEFCKERSVVVSRFFEGCSTTFSSAMEV